MTSHAAAVRYSQRRGRKRICEAIAGLSALWSAISENEPECFEETVFVTSAMKVQGRAKKQLELLQNYTKGCHS